MQVKTSVAPLGTVMKKAPSASVITPDDGLSLTRTTTPGSGTPEASRTVPRTETVTSACVFPVAVPEDAAKFPPPVSARKVRGRTANSANAASFKLSFIIIYNQ